MKKLLAFIVAFATGTLIGEYIVHDIPDWMEAANVIWHQSVAVGIYHWWWTKND